MFHVAPLSDEAMMEVSLLEGKGLGNPPATATKNPFPYVTDVHIFIVNIIGLCATFGEACSSHVAPLSDEVMTR